MLDAARQEGVEEDNANQERKRAAVASRKQQGDAIEEALDDASRARVDVQRQASRSLEAGMTEGRRQSKSKAPSIAPVSSTDSEDFGLEVDCPRPFTAPPAMPAESDSDSYNRRRPIQTLPRDLAAAPRKALSEVTSGQGNVGARTPSVVGKVTATNTDSDSDSYDIGRPFPSLPENLSGSPRKALSEVTSGQGNVGARTPSVVGKVTATNTDSDSDSYDIGRPFPSLPENLSGSPRKALSEVTSGQVNAGARTCKAPSVLGEVTAAGDDSISGTPRRQSTERQAIVSPGRPQMNTVSSQGGNLSRNDSDSSAFFNSLFNSQSTKAASQGKCESRNRLPRSVLRKTHLARVESELAEDTSSATDSSGFLA